MDLAGIARFEWDAGKSLENERRRGLPFSGAVAIFSEWRLEWCDIRFDYGEVRVHAIGSSLGESFVCIYSVRDSHAGRSIRIISFRLANRKERHAYRESFPGPVGS